LPTKGDSLAYFLTIKKNQTLNCDVNKKLVISYLMAMVSESGSRVAYLYTLDLLLI